MHLDDAGCGLFFIAGREQEAVGHVRMYGQRERFRFAAIYILGENAGFLAFLGGAEAVHAINDAHGGAVDEDGRELIVGLGEFADVIFIFAFDARRIGDLKIGNGYLFDWELVKINGKKSVKPRRIPHCSLRPAVLMLRLLKATERQDFPVRDETITLRRNVSQSLSGGHHG